MSASRTLKEYRRIALSRAFLDRPSIHLRTESELILAGVLSERSWDMDDEQLAKQIRRSEHHRGCEGGESPVVCINENGNTKVLDVSCLLFHTSMRVRKTCWRYLRKMCSVIDAGDVTTEALLRNERLIAAESPEVWRVAARDTYDALSHDMSVSLAGFRVAAAAKDSSTSATYYPRIIRPDYRVITNLCNSKGASVKKTDDLRRSARKISNEAKTLDEVINRYLDQLGYLPLAAENSLAHILQEWASKNKTVVDDEAVWHVATRSKHPLAKAHALLCILAMSQEPLPLCSKYSEHIKTTFRPAKTDSPDAIQYDSLAFVCAAATYYAIHLQYVVPGCDGDVVAAVSWWIAAELGGVIVALDEDCQKQVMQGILSECNRAQYLNANVPAPSNTSRFLYATTHVQTLWHLALMRSIAEKCGPVWPFGDDAQLSGSIGSALLSWLPVPPSMESRSRYLFELDTEIMTKANTLASGAGAAASATIAVYAECCTDAGFARRLTDLPQTHGDERLVICHTFLVRSLLGTKAPPDLMALLRDVEWFTASLEGEQEPAANALASALIACQVNSSTDPLHYGLPHVFAARCEQCTDCELLHRLFAYTVTSCIAVNATSAIDRLKRTATFSNLREDILKLRERLDEFVHAAPPWAAACARAMMAALA